MLLRPAYLAPTNELSVTIPDEELEAPSSVLEVHEQVAGELSDPCARRAGGETQDMNAPSLDLPPVTAGRTASRAGLSRWAASAGAGHAGRARRSMPAATKPGEPSVPSRACAWWPCDNGG
ncbi:hypothetical protein GCM10010246_59310 [Streptomyces cuspidosporus]|uniref:Uncharacterized protein n=1 Tax=Streptomyces cuspidosporus TaxID=66882 RepID=A0ABP5TT09_9ACTN